MFWRSEDVFIVTGAASGLGRAIGLAFADQGATVISLSRRHVEIEGLTWVSCDVSDETSVTKAFSQITDRFGPPSGLVNNAGTARQMPFADTSLADWRSVLDVNLTGAFLCSRAFLRERKPDSEGFIINIASQAARHGMALLAPYCASKAGLLGLTRALAVELAPQVRVNAICPGQVLTPMIEAEIATRMRLSGETRNAVEKAWLDRIPLGRFQAAEDIAQAAVYLATANNITGIALDVSGGLVMV